MVASGSRFPKAGLRSWIVAGSTLLLICIAYSCWRAAEEALEFRSNPHRSIALGERLLGESGPSGWLARAILFHPGTRPYEEELRGLAYGTDSPLSDTAYNRFLLDRDLARLSEDEREIYLRSYPLTPSNAALTSLAALMEGDARTSPTSYHAESCGTFHALARSSAGRQAVVTWTQGLFDTNDLATFVTAFRCLIVGHSQQAIAGLEHFWDHPELERSNRMRDAIEQLQPGEAALGAIFRFVTVRLERREASMEDVGPLLGILWRSAEFNAAAASILRERSAAWADELIASEGPDTDEADSDDPDYARERYSYYAQPAIDDYFGVIDEETTPAWAVSRVRAQMVGDERHVATLPTADASVVAVASALRDQLRERSRDDLAVQLIDSLSRSNVLTAERVAFPSHSGHTHDAAGDDPEGTGTPSTTIDRRSRFHRNAVVVLLDAGSALAADQVDTVFSDGTYHDAELSVWNYVYASAAAAEYAQLAKHGYVQTGKLWPPAGFERGYLDDPTEWSNFITRYPQFPGTDDAYYRLAFALLNEGQIDDALRVVASYYFGRGMQAGDRDADPYVAHLIAYIALNQLEHRPFPGLGLEHVAALRRTTGMELLLAPPSDRSVRAALDWFLEDRARCRLLTTPARDVTLLRQTLDLDPRLRDCERVGAIATLVGDGDRRTGIAAIGQLAAIGIDDPAILRTVARGHSGVERNPRRTRYADADDARRNELSAAAALTRRCLQQLTDLTVSGLRRARAKGEH